jgi:site-specific recombinase XerC
MGVLRLISKETFIALIELDNLRRVGRPDYLAYRSRAAAFLAYCGGLWFPEIMALRRAHWMPEGKACILIEATAERSPRRIPASPAVKWAVQRYLAERPGALEDGPLFACEGGLPLKQEITNAIRNSGASGERKVGSGELRASFEESILRAYRDEPLSYYLIGMVPPGRLPRIVEDPPLPDLDRLLRNSGHLYFDSREIWRGI